MLSDAKSVTKVGLGLTKLRMTASLVMQLKGLSKEIIRYKRSDGVDLMGTLYLPPKYDAARDGPLPLIMWAYPRSVEQAWKSNPPADTLPSRISLWGDERPRTGSSSSGFLPEIYCLKKLLFGGSRSCQRPQKSSRSMLLFLRRVHPFRRAGRPPVAFM
jgi:hypothetical protein